MGSPDGTSGPNPDLLDQLVFCIRIAGRDDSFEFIENLKRRFRLKCSGEMKQSQMKDALLFIGTHITTRKQYKR